MLNKGKMHNQILYTFCFIQLLFSRWVMSNSFVTPWPVACQAPLATELSRILARILEWGAIPFFRGSSQARDQIWVSYIGDSLLLSHWGSAFIQLHRFYRCNLQQQLFCVQGRFKSKTATENVTIHLKILPNVRWVKHNEFRKLCVIYLLFSH